MTPKRQLVRHGRWKNFTQDQGDHGGKHREFSYKLECGPMANVMAALPNIGVQRSKVLLTPTTRVLCSNTAKTRNTLKCTGVSHTLQQISAAGAPKFIILLYNKFFSDCRYVPELWRYSPTKLCDGALMANFWLFLGPAFLVSRLQHISDLHSKFALGGEVKWSE